MDKKTQKVLVRTLREFNAAIDDVGLRGVNNHIAARVEKAVHDISRAIKRIKEM